MKQSQVKPGVRALLSLGRRGGVAVTGHMGADGSVYPVIPGKRFNGLGYGPAEKGQTIDAGDVVIETTLHRLG
jgi:hypothetical protein